jgi:hypothetical protein
MVLKHLNGGKFKTKNETMVTQKSLVQESVDLVYCGSNQVNCDHRLNRNSVLECVSVTLEVKKKSRGAPDQPTRHWINRASGQKH